MSKNVIIIGAGPGGLSTAMLLAARGFKVQVIERQPYVGGRTSTFEKGGYKFDLGPTFFMYPRILEEIYQEAGYDLNQEVEMRRLDPQYRLLFGQGGQIDTTPDLESMRQQLAAISPGDADGFERFMAENRKKLAVFRPILESPFNGWGDMLRKQLLAAVPYLNPHQSVDRYLRKFFKDERTRLAFCFQSKYLGMSPFRCPSLFSILSFLEYEYGVFHPIGGCGVLSDSMARLARQMGVEILLGEPVKRMKFQGRKVTGVVTTKGEYDADAVVVNADFARAMTSLVPDNLRKRWTNRKLSKKKFSCSTFMLYLGIDGEFELPHHTIYIAKDYEKNLRDIEKLHVLSDDPSFYVQNASVTDPTLAPRGKSALYMLVPVPHKTKNIDWRHEARPYREKILQTVAKAGFTDLEHRIEVERMITPADWDQGQNIHLGATFNLAHTLSQMLHLRPRNRFEDLDGVYLVGGGTHPGSGLPVIFESARITSNLMSEDFGVSEPAKQEEAERELVAA
ncbi:MAG: phytoene desaturase [Verrucomicrobiales bacterium]|jgi:phytoene desaturase